MRQVSCELSYIRILYFTLLYFVGDVFTAECPADWTYVASVDSCYKVVNQRLDWDGAVLGCQALHSNSHLLVTSDQAEQDAVEAMMTAHDRQYPLLIHNLHILVD